MWANSVYAMLASMHQPLNRLIALKANVGRWPCCKQRASHLLCKMVLSKARLYQKNVKPGVVQANSLKGREYWVHLKMSTLAFLLIVCLLPCLALFSPFFPFFLFLFCPSFPASP